MLIRSSPAKLERLRLPYGPLRVNWDHPLAANLRGLWVGNAQNLCADISRQNPDLTFQGSAAVSSGAEGDCLDCSPSGTSGVRLLVNTGSPLSITTDGMTVFSRFAPTSTNSNDNAVVFGIQYAGEANPFSIQAIGRAVATTDLKYFWNAAGTFYSTSSSGATMAANVPVSVAFSRIYGVSSKAYTAGVERASNTVNGLLAPNYSGSSDIFAIGYNGVSNRNSQLSFYIGGVVAHGWSAQEAALFEADPYGLVEQDRSFLSMMPYTAPTGLAANMLRGGGAAANPLRGYLA